MLTVVKFNGFFGAAIRDRQDVLRDVLMQIFQRAMNDKLRDRKKKKKTRN